MAKKKAKAAAGPAKKTAAKATPIRKGGKSQLVEPKQILDDDIDPHHQWKRPLQAPGHTQVDFEERVNFRRLHTYRLARVRQALAGSGLGALLSFDQHNIRYTTSTVIGEWARDKLLRYSLITGNGEPYIWDFGSAAKHHKLYAPWLHNDHCRAGMLGMRGAVGSDITLFRDAAREIKAILDEEGVGHMPVGVDVVEPPMLFELQKAGIEVRDGQQTMLLAREIKSHDEITLLNMAAAMVDGVYQDIAEALKPGIKESRDRRARGGPLVRDGLRLRRGDQLDRRRALLAASAQFHGPLDSPRRPGVLRRHPLVHRLSHVLLPHVRGRPRDGAATHGVSQGARVDGPHDRALEARHGQRRGRARAADSRRDRLLERDRRVRLELLPRLGARPARAAADLARHLVPRSDRAQGRHGVRRRDVLPGDGRHLGRAHRGRGRADADGAKIITLYPAEDLPIANPY